MGLIYLDTATKGPEDIQRWATDLLATMNGALADVYRRIALHADSIMQLTEDERGKALAAKLGSLACAQITDYRDAAGELTRIWMCRASCSGC